MNGDIEYLNINKANVTNVRPQQFEHIITTRRPHVHVKIYCVPNLLLMYQFERFQTTI